MKKIAIVSYPADLHASYVCERMASHDAEPLLLNLGEYPSNLEVGLTLCGARAPKLMLQTANWAVNAEDIFGVWWRRPLGAYRDVDSSLDRQYVASESEAVVRSLSKYMPHSRWVSDPDATQLAGRKPLQLRIAQSVGFRIPKTVLGNSPIALQMFLQGIGDLPVVIKAVNNSFIRLNRSAQDLEKMNRVVYTQTVSSDFLMDRTSQVRNCPFIVQEAINKELDVRVTVVGERIFAMGIDVRGSEKSSVPTDWRRMDAARKYMKHELPDELSGLCRRLTVELGLRFGCIDLAYSEREGYTFFEINPQGQWLVSEQVLGLPIADALVELLVSREA